ncbi:MAG TPA: response regulator [Pseudobdellovibrionaceae bacterium]|nr:response regulator [Pseudobdellovibrionaceae bacterium]
MSAARQLKPQSASSVSALDAAADASLSKSLVYFVDDEPALREVFRARFHDQFQIKTFASGFELVSQLSSGQLPRPELIITDLRMPGMDGVQMLAALQALGHEVPAILLSGNLDKDSAIAANNRGFLRLIEKPFEPSHVEACVIELLQESKVRRIRHEIRLQVKRLTEIYQAMRLILEDRIPNFQEILDETLMESNGEHATKSFEGVIHDIESRLDELIKLEQRTESLRKSRH